MSEIFSKILKDKNGKVLNVGSKYKQPEWGAETLGLVEILPETELTVMEEVGAAMVMQEVTLTEGNVYTVNYNGTEYACTAISNGSTNLLLGNTGAIDETFPVTDEPFIFMTIPEEQRDQYMGACAIAVPLDGSITFTLSIKEKNEEIHKIPAEYAEHAPVEPLIITVTGMQVGVNSGYKIDRTWKEIEQAVVAGRMVYFSYATEMYAIANFDPNNKRVWFIRIEINNTSESTLGIATFEVTDRGGIIGMAAIRTVYVLVSNPGNPAT